MNYFKTDTINCFSKKYNFKFQGARRQNRVKDLPCMQPTLIQSAALDGPLPSYKARLGAIPEDRAGSSPKHL